MREIARWVPAVLLASTLLLLGAARPSVSPELRGPLDSLPRSIADFEARDVVIDDEERRVAGMTDYVLREFSGEAGTAFSLYVGYYDYQLRGKTIHSPKNCLPGGGWEALRSDRTTVRVDGRELEVNRYVIAQGSRRALVYYWYQGRGRVAADEYLVKWDLLRHAALYGRTEEALVRVALPLSATTSLAAAESEADRLARRIAEAVIPRLDDVLPAWRGEGLLATRQASTP